MLVKFPLKEIKNHIKSQIVIKIVLEFFLLENSFLF